MNSTYSSSDSSTSAISYNTINGYMDASTLIGQLTIKKEKSISPTLYFKSVKMKMGIPNEEKPIVENKSLLKG